MRWLDGITDLMDINLVRGREAWHAAVHGVTTKIGYDLATEQQQQHFITTISFNITEILQGWTCLSLFSGKETGGHMYLAQTISK